MTRYLAMTLLALLSADLVAQQKPPTPQLSGFRVTSEGGVEGARTVRYDENGRPIDGSVPREVPRGPQGPTRPGLVAPTTPVTPTAQAPAAASVQSGGALRTADGRPLPFTLSSRNGPKTVDESVDADSALRDFGRPNDLLSQRFPTAQLDLTRDERFATTQRVTLGTWNSSFSSLGTRRADIALEDGLGAEVRSKDTIEVRQVERSSSPWSRRTTEVAGWDNRLEGDAELGQRTVDAESLAGTVARANTTARSPRSLDQLSMQDINRYQFRRARSSDPGLPVVRPGTGTEVRSTGGN